MPELSLLLGQEIAGTVSRTAAGKLTFTYAAGYTGESKSATPVSVSMPSQVASHTDNQITPWLWGLLPDNEAVLNRWAREFHVSANSAFALLATPLGEDCPGAVRLIPSDRLEAVRTDRATTDVDWLSEAQVAQRLRDLKNDATAWLGASRTTRAAPARATSRTFSGESCREPLPTAPPRASSTLSSGTG